MNNYGPLTVIEQVYFLCLEFIQTLEFMLVLMKPVVS